MSKAILKALPTLQAEYKENDYKDNTSYRKHTMHITIHM